MRIDLLKKEVLSRYRWITRVIDTYESRLNKMPAGHLRVKSRTSAPYYYHVDDKNNPNGHLIKDRELIVNLAAKTYMIDCLRKAKTEQRVLKHFLDHYPDKSIEDIYPGYSRPRRRLITPVTVPDEEFRRRWENTPYIPKGIKDGQPVYITMRGEKVRSKSEMIIANALFSKGIPYKYECPLVINGVTIHPDFTILRLSDRQEVYLEHLGMMGDEDYAGNAITRIDNYTSNGILLGDRLFITMESKTAPFGAASLNLIIDKQLR